MRFAAACPMKRKLALLPEKLLAAEDMLLRLEAAGVDNWEGYSECFGGDEEDDEDDD